MFRWVIEKHSFQHRNSNQSCSLSSPCPGLGLWLISSSSNSSILWTVDISGQISELGPGWISCPLLKAMLLASHEILCSGHFSDKPRNPGEESSCPHPAFGNWSSSELVAPTGEPFGGATLLADTAVHGEGGYRRKTWVPGDTGTGIHGVVEGREAQCLSSVTTVKGSRETGFYKKRSRGFHGARKSICRRGTCEVTVHSSGKPPLAYWRTQHSSLRKGTSSQRTSKAVEELNHLHLIDIYTPAQTSRTFNKQDHIFWAIKHTSTN